MKIIYVILGIIIIGTTSCGNRSAANDRQIAISQGKAKPKSHKVKENLYVELRDMAFKTTPDKLGISLPADKTIVYGVIMDWEIGGAIATIVSYQTGDASLYLSSGGAVIGGGQHQKVNNEARQLVSLSQKYLSNATKADMSPLPASNEVKFYLLTNKGVYVGQEQMKNFENNSSVWFQLFEQGNKVLTELRNVSKK